MGRESGRELGDERILGSGAFVERMLKEAERSLSRRYWGRELQKRVQRAIGEMCQKHKVTVQELRAGSRRGRTATTRAEIIQRLVKRHGLPLAEIARHVGISTSGVSRVLSRAQTLSS